MEKNETNLLQIADGVSIALSEIEFNAIRAQGPGGQNVNKVSSAIHLRFDIAASSLPEVFKERLLQLNDQRLTKDGVIVIKAQNARSQEQNRMQALLKLQELLHGVSIVQAKRRATRPTRRSQVKRVESKVKRGLDKAMRRKVES